MTDIAIIGAGLSGRLLAVNLLRQATHDVSIQMFERGEANSMGAAYSSNEGYLLLNVPACRMGAFSEDAEHFLKWVREKGISAGPWDFLPRKLYRDYVFSLLEESQLTGRNGSSFELIRGEVIDLQPGQNGATLYVQGKGAFPAHKVVLALGNFPPRNPHITNRVALTSHRYVRDPWAFSGFSSLQGNERVVFIGSGQTMVDLLVGLYRRGHTGRIVSISRRGILPLAHKGFEPYPSFYAEIKDSTCLLEILRSVRRHLDEADRHGIDIRSVIDSLRPDTQELWLALPEAEKRRFLRHLFRYWEIIRSRIPPESDLIIQQLCASGQLQIIPGRIRNMVENETGIEVHYSSPEGIREEVVKASLVINCIGPESDIERVEHPLVKNLLRRGLVRPGPARLGIDAQPQGAVIGRQGETSGFLYTMGSMMKGILWEVIAVPDIRLQAEQLAGLLLGHTHLQLPAETSKHASA
jgi:uncharacterized NAD(P)/FAD-binding protein YdhS